jgi:heme-degrading monooxygenase HmoA
MIVTVFRSRLLPEAAQAQSEYAQWSKRMSDIAVTMPGYISHKGFVAEDGERLTLVEFESEAALGAWSAHPEHRAAKKNGRQRFYTDYHVQVCNLVRESKFKRA